MKILFFIILFCTTVALNAQKLYLIDSESKKAIDGAVATLQSLHTGNSSSKVSEGGKIIIQEEWLPAVVQIDHLSYETLLDTLFSIENLMIYLKPKSKVLAELVFTGQFNPQSARNSVYQVRTIDQKRIQSQGATNLQTVLQNELNLRFSRDNALGTSGMNLQGISGQNVKVLIDGIPVVGRSGVANEIDLGQLNINSIEKIEIVEGPMAVMYGADALAGVINIITKKSGDNKFNLDLTMHEETVGNEYNLHSEGIHNPYLQMGYQLNDQWFVRLEGGLNYFGGWQGNRTGRDKQWHPKSQYLTGGTVNYVEDNFNVYFRSDYMHEVITDLGAEINANLIDPFALDEKFISTRWMNQLQAEWKLGDHSILNSAFSFTDYERISKPYSKNLVTQQENIVFDDMDTVFYSSFFTRHTFLQKIAEHDFQLGMDATFETAGGTTLNPGTKYLNDLGFFLSAELEAGKLKVRPGVRYTVNSVFATIPTPSINFKYDFSKKLSLRAGYGRGFRAPSIREMYHEFIDTNHNLLGNPNLEPEYSHNLNGDITYRLLDHWQLNFAGFYNQISNRISILLPEQADRPWTYTNINEFKTTGITLRSELELKNLSMQTGFAYTGRFQILSDEFEYLPNFLFSPEVNQNITYRVPDLDVSLAAFYKFTGAFQDYRVVDQLPQLRQINSFHWLDLTLSKPIGKYLDLTIGARNLLNITAVDNSMPGGVHSGNQEGVSAIANGRSYFARLNFKLNFN